MQIFFRFSVIAASTGLFSIAIVCSNSSKRLVSSKVQAQELKVAKAVKPVPPPLFDQVGYYSTTISGKDPADVYFPVASKQCNQIQRSPIALMLPGALVNKLEYSVFASIVARYGFVIVVPQHIRSVPQFKFTGELAEASQITDVLTHMQRENITPTSPVANRIDPQKLVLLGHSHGGFVGLSAIANICIAPFCVGEFTRPKELVAGAFYGVNSQNPSTGKYSPISNLGVPVALIQGSLDGIATVKEAQNTFELIQDPPKALIVIEGANHYGITNVNNPPGATPDKNSPAIKQKQEIEAISQSSALFLRAYSLNDAAALEYIKSRNGITLKDGEGNMREETRESGFKK